MFDEGFDSGGDFGGGDDMSSDVVSDNGADFDADFGGDLDMGMDDAVDVDTDTDMDSDLGADLNDADESVDDGLDTEADMDNEIEDDLNDEPVDEPTDDLNDEPADESTDAVSEEPADEPTDDLNDEPADESTDDLNDEPADEPTDAVGDEPDDETTDETHSTPSGMHDNLTSPDLFTNAPKGEYEYSQNDHGKSASGHLDTPEETKRNPRAQLAAGGDEREATDDGGHLIGARFGGASGLENLDAQNRDVNRRGFKGLENEWASELKNGNNVYVNVENYNSNASERPDATMGYSIVEDKNGNRTWDAFSFQNASYAEQEEWANTINEADIDDAYPNPMRDSDNFDQSAYEQVMNEDISNKKPKK